MTPQAPPAATGIRPAPVAPPRPALPPRSPWVVAARFLATGLILAAYFGLRGTLLDLLGGALDQLERWAGLDHSAAAPRVAAVTLLGTALVAVWWPVIKADPRFHAPILITYILALANAGYGVLEDQDSRRLAWLTGDRVTSYSPTFVVMAVTMLAELVLARFLTGKWPHLASAYISGISAGILIKSSLLWPFVFCGLISITSKYVLRVGGRHVFNPTNFGVTAVLFLAADSAASLTVQSGNELWPVLLIWALGSLILYRLRLLHIPLVFVAAFVPLAFVRTLVTGNPIVVNDLWGVPVPFTPELAPVTWPMFQLFIFFMITDPKTVTHTRRRQCLVAVLIAVAETALRLGFRDVHSLYHSLFLVGPAANLIEIRYEARKKARAAAALPAPPPGAADPAAVKPGPSLGVAT